MRNVLIPEAGNGMNFYRANLHCHTTISDGKKTPEEVKDNYEKNQGLAIVDLPILAE